MNMRSILLVLIALIVAGGTAFYARTLLSTPTSGPVVVTAQDTSTLKVLVAKKALPVGKIIDEQDYEWRIWPKSAAGNGFIVEGQDTATALGGKVARVAMIQGQPITTAALVGPGEHGFLAAVLEPGMRAVTISVSDTSGVAGFVFPGDRVDILVTHEVPRPNGSILRVSETVLRNVRVLAIDQTTDPADNTPKVGQTITLEVTPKLVEKISVMQRLGTLSLSLRSLAREGESGPSETDISDSSEPTDLTPSYTLASEVSKFASLSMGGGGGGVSDGGASRRDDAPQETPSPSADREAKPKPKGPVLTVSRGSESQDINLGAN